MPLAPTPARSWSRSTATPASTLIACEVGATGKVGSATGRMTPEASAGCARTRAPPPTAACVVVERPLTAKLTPAKAACVASALAVEVD